MAFYRSGLGVTLDQLADFAKDTAKATYGTMYGMKKTTVYLPDDLKAALEKTAAAQGRSEADLIREAVRELTRRAEPPRPRLPLFTGEDPTLARRFDEELRGFGG